MFLQQRQKAALDKFRSGTNVGKEICLFSQLERHPLPLPLKKKDCCGCCVIRVVVAFFLASYFFVGAVYRS